MRAFRQWLQNLLGRWHNAWFKWQLWWTLLHLSEEDQDAMLAEMRRIVQRNAQKETNP